jgi:hypothetical protein
MGFTTKTITRELKSIPFDICNRIYNDAAQVAADTLEAFNREKYDKYISQLESQWTETNEAPYEGNFSDEVPYVPHPDLAKVRKRAGYKAIIEEFIPRYKLDTIMQTWVMSQVITYIARKPFRINEMLDPKTELISGIKVLDHVFDSKSEWDMGLYRFLMLDQRSSYLQTQYKGEGKLYCSLVPLILYAFKLHHNVKYCQWSKDTLHYVVNESLYDAMMCEVPEDLTREDILEAREQGLVYATGAKAGEARNPISTYKLYSTMGTKLHGLPELAKTMLAQIWCAHPHNRTKYMVLDPRNWDSIPAPLVSDDIFGNKAEYVPGISKTNAAAMPWD